jgi:hypothetical protein
MTKERKSAGPAPDYKSKNPAEAGFPAVKSPREIVVL